MLIIMMMANISMLLRIQNYETLFTISSSSFSGLTNYMVDIHFCNNDQPEPENILLVSCYLELENTDALISFCCSALQRRYLRNESAFADPFLERIIGSVFSVNYVIIIYNVLVNYVIKFDHRRIFGPMILDSSVMIFMLVCQRLYVKCWSL